MLILEAMNIRKYYGDRLITWIDELKIQKGDRIGVVGQNGAGKTSLLNILSGEVLPDEGIVKRYCDIAYIKQFTDDMINADSKILKEFNVIDKILCDGVSGGEHTRLKIADALSKNSMLLFADEPTANLDYEGINTLKEKLMQIETLLLISHDRDLLDSLCNRIIEVRDGKLSFYEGNFTAYEQQKKMEIEREWFEYNQYVDEKSRLEEAVIDRENRSKSMNKAPKRMGNSEARLHKEKVREKRKKLDGAANIIKSRLEKLEVKQRPGDVKTIRLDFSLTNPPENRVVISCDDLSFSYGKNDIFIDSSFRVFNRAKTAIIGSNGAGKTTLLRIINSMYKNINIVPKAAIGYFCQGFENLDYSKTVLQNVMEDSVQTETTARTILARLLISGDDVYKKVGILSGGEKIKAAFAKIFVSRANILLLDEPTNYLDMLSIEALENVLCEYEGTILFVSHDRTFVNKAADRLLIIKDKKIEEFEGNLSEYEEKSRLKTSDGNMIEEALLKMRLTEIISKLSLPDQDRNALEAEYSETLKKLEKLKDD